MSTKRPHNLNDQVASILALVEGIQNQLCQDDNSETLALPDETVELLEKTLHWLLSSIDPASTSTRRQLDTEGTKLWNMCVQRMRTLKANNDTVLLCKVKALAYAMLEVAAPKTDAGSYRSLELAFQITKTCIDQKLTDLSQKFMECTATRLDILDKSKSDSSCLKFESFTTEYYMLRIYLAWTQERPDIADHLFSKLPVLRTRQQQDVVLDICYAIGGAALGLGQNETASIWLDRAITACESLQEEGQEVNRGLKEKRLLILQAFARANIQLTTASSDGHLQKTLDLLKNEYGKSFCVLVISLAALSNKWTTDEEYFETLRSAIDVMDVSDMNFKLMHYYVAKLGKSSPGLFIEACGLLFNKLKASNTNSKEQWMENIFVSIVWTLTNTTSDMDSSALAETTAGKMTECGLEKLSENATYASLILIWKYVDTMISKRLISVAEQWCRFVLKQPIFHKTTDTEAKFFRKLILCGLEDVNPSRARKIFDEIPENCKSCPLTLYLLYRLALFAGDTSIGTVIRPPTQFIAANPPEANIHLQTLCRSGDGTEYIWSCVEDALQLDKTDIAVKELDELISILDSNSSGNLHISQLLQYMIWVVYEKYIKRQKESVLTHVESLFESALNVAGKGLLSSAEIHWLSFKSYSIALDIYESVTAQRVIRFLKVSQKFMELSEKEPGAELDASSVDHNLRCDFLQAIPLIKEARSKGKPSTKASYYTEARQAIKQFQAHIKVTNSDSTPEPHPGTWVDKYRIMLSFDFEAAVFLRQWEDLGNILEASKPIVDINLSSIFLDCILRSGAPSSCQSRVVKQMIRIFHSSPSSTFRFSDILPRYLRCLFSLSTQAEEYVLAESVLDQALILARDNPIVRAQYPKEELEWLATVSFNRAVEFFLMSADEECNRWARKAIALADLIEEDRGELGRHLRGNLAKLQSY
ncbi:uncharacterized protein BJX67DRAFT_376535 [Aspergillus lucknowensis]|uniref:Meiosis protein SPO22/ZIP4 like-domain-containing protein n=1 Tax=Aspergillus lucknowensis TaxID=176173 RepID=A0ABR4M814_9EURO